MRNILICIAIVLFVLMPFGAVLATSHQGSGPGRTATLGFIPCDGVENKCDFQDLVQLTRNIITWLLWAAVFIAAIAFTWGGFIYVTSAGDTGKVSQAHAIFKNVAIGFILALSAWLIVYTITTALLEDPQGSTILEPS